MVHIDYMMDPGWPYLRQAEDLALKEQAARRFDNKTHAWVPDAQEGFVVASIGVQEGVNLTLTLPDGSQKKLTTSEVQEINPAKFEKTEDMSNLTFLNEASVLHNLRQRYYSMMIYTYSGLFCVFINPYKMLPIYTDSVANMYVNKRRAEMPPHLFAVSDEAFRNMMSDRENQSMLITGESGAGKTENTKKVIAYFAMIGGGSKVDGKANESSLENQVVQANPAIEAFGNGATTRNYNSSRYGKFIRIHFDRKGRLVGGDIEHYLLEKSRVIKQAPGERSYHIFYQIMTQKNLKERYLLSDDIRQYKFVSQAEISVPGMDDKEEWGITDNAFSVMGFSDREKDDLYKLCAAIMHIGNSTFKQKPRDEQAEVDDMTSPTNACKLFGINVEHFLTALTRPKIKVGTEWVNKGQNVQQVDWAVGALSKAIYARMFTWLIKRVNQTLRAKLEDSVYYIGVLDIAGFEIFDRNSFEQLWINFVNEKLQQFFNHHMFVLEQEEYKREGIEWTFIDFGLDLQACIELIEKPLGIVSMLDEECIVPKATDMTYVDKLTTQHLGKHPNFQKAKAPKGKQAEAHFAIVHYAGTVRYNAEQWLDKNKDPLNDSAVACLKTSDKEGILYQIWEDYVTDVDREESEKRGKGQQTKKKGKSASFLTVSTMYRESLNSLMTMLHTTHPHFIRCIIPNEKKTSGLVDAPLVLNQLTCNGVLEGIRICRKGFPNRLIFADFRYRYAILASDEASEKDASKASKAMLRKLAKANQINVDNFKIGATKVFFRAGMLARLEELRDEALSKVMVKFQAATRAYLALCDYKSRLDREDAYPLIQENVRAWIKLRSWPWFRLFSRLKPMLKGMKSNAEIEALEKKCKELEESSKREEEQRKKYADELRAKIEQYEETKAALERDRMMLDKRNKEIEELNRNLKKEQESAYENAKKAAELERAREKEKKEWEEKERRLQMEAENEANRNRAANEKLKDQLASLQTEHDKIQAQRKAQEHVNGELTDQVASLRQKYEKADEQRNKMKEDLDALDDKLAAEQRLNHEMAKQNKKLESQLKAVQTQLEIALRDKHEFDLDCRKRETDVGELKRKGQSDANLIAKLQASLRRCIDRIEQLEEDLLEERKLRMKTERQRNELQSEYDLLTEQMAEASGQLTAETHINKIRAEELSNLRRDLQKKSLNQEAYISDLCTMQYATVNNLRNLSQQSASLESEALRILDARRAFNKVPLPRVYVDDSDVDDSI
ncbi:unnamed protein product [Caenorhabditis auriculariae]|uniref:Myosin motor domain-containing protein n=1 Tax=Caenorhabditis auriculariae TaxID=2777116 RepID=A0A8S1HLG3_9PELO|nr:unnamed protein product [Caenorhabditis auriculariae]